MATQTSTPASTAPRRTGANRARQGDPATSPSGQHEWQPSPNLPPFTFMDLAGIGVAIVGTFALILLATGTASGNPDSPGFVTVGRILLAIYATLINLAHIVGMLLFESVNYHGVFQRFFARMSLIGTPVAVAVSLSLGLF